MSLSWFMRVIAAREQYLNNAPYTSLEALESYAEKTYSTLLYLTLSSLPMHSLAADHLASHIGKASGIVAVLRGLPLIAFPPLPNHHNNPTGFGDLPGGGGGGGRLGAVTLPLDIMSETGVKEEEVFRKGAQAHGLKDAVFKVATRANDHLITAREMLKNLQSGKDIGHEFEHEGEEGHEYTSTSAQPRHSLLEVERGFGALIPVVATNLWLQRLEKHDFDVFRPELRRREWMLPWKAYWAFSQRKF
jgi:NADH dehydrogenase [ubiquinone] 1 alpha subcomplex assembly factor 6